MCQANTCISYCLKCNNWSSARAKSVFGIAVAVVVVVWKKLFYKKVLLVEVGLKK